MNEGTKTGVFLTVAAVLAVCAAIVSWPRGGAETAASSMVGKQLFENFSDPLAAASMKIVTFDSTLGQLDSFEVAKDSGTGVWSIPSRKGYPADATEQMRKAASSMLGLKILDMKTDLPEDHANFGVVEPDVEKLEVGDDGVGRLVTIKDDKGTSLVSLVIGDTVKDAPTHRYVRVPNQDPVYEVELDDSALTTQFNKWIEDDLLKLSSIDVAGANIQNYSVAIGLGRTGQLIPQQQRSYDAKLSLDDTNQWSLDSLVVYDDGKTGTARSLAENEQLNTEALNKLKNALDDLKIVDVARKPDGMSADLKADRSLVEDQESLESLFSRGFYPVTANGGERVEILSSNGELTVDLRDGVQYVLRFGDVAGITDTEDGEEAGEDPAAKENEGGAERYLLVTTRVNQAMIPAPEATPIPETLEELAALRNPPTAPAAPAPGMVLPNPLAPPANAPANPEPTNPEPVNPEPAEVDQPEPAQPEAPAEPVEPENPAEPAQPAEPAESPAEPAAAEPQPTEEAPADATGEGTAELSGTGEASGNGQEAGQEQPPQEAAGDTEAAEDVPPQEDAAKEEAPAEQPTESNPPADAAPETVTEVPAAQEQPTTTPAADPPANEWDDLTEEEKKEYLEAEREKIRKENQRLVSEWKERVEETERKVRELNARFADWYYIIPESTYSNLQIDLGNLVQDKSAAPPAQPTAPPAGLPQFNF